MGKAFLQTIFPLFFTACLSAQPAALDLNAIGPQDGLESGYNYHLHQDSRGFLWISSVNGLYRSDGLSIKSWTSEDGLRGNIVQSNFYEDAVGDGWFSTYNGINHYRRATDDFRSFQTTSEKGDTIKEDYYFIHLEKGKALWFRAGVWLCRYDIANQQVARLSTTAGVSFGVDTAANGSVKRIYACPWMNAGGFELFTLGPSLKLEKKAHLQSSAGGKRVEISNALVEHDTLAWLFSNQGLYSFNPYSPANFRRYSLPDKGNTLIKRGIFYGTKYILALTKNNGPCFFDRLSRKFLSATDAPIGFNLQAKNYQAVMVDREDNCWFAHDENPSIEFGSLLQKPFIYPKTEKGEPLPSYIHLGKAKR
ncbi:MAG: hypothetical protein IPN76_23005 [Saprospiraceae bacterium]|nr:hypothetical protein [Saprospiraceae bacterium]